MTPTTAPPALTPPVGYPHRDWSEAPDWQVPEDVRPDYAAAADRGVGSVEKYAQLPDPGFLWRQEDGSREWRAADYPTWAHWTRLADAEETIRRRKDAAEYVARTTVTCVVCNQDRRTSHATQVLVEGSPVWTCLECGPLLRAELVATEPVAGGRNRLEAVRATVAELTGRVVR